MTSPAFDTRTTRTWEFLDTGNHSGDYNMKMDEFLAKRLLARVGSPTLRVYGWRPAAISLGYNQLRRDLDEIKCMADGIDIVRRPTGGRAILHDEELTYSVVMFADGKTIADICGDISKALVEGLGFLGAELEYASVQPDFRRLYRRTASAPCFSSAARYEIQYRGKKVAGSAQRRYASPDGAEVVLQHGSILLGTAHRKLAELLRAESENERESIRTQLDARTIELNRVLGRPVSFGEVAHAVKRGFERAWGIDFAAVDVEYFARDDAAGSMHEVKTEKVVS